MGVGVCVGGWGVDEDRGCDILTKECQQMRLLGGGSASSPRARHCGLKQLGPRWPANNAPLPGHGSWGERGGAGLASLETLKFCSI